MEKKKLKDKLIKKKLPTDGKSWVVTVIVKIK